MHWPAAHSVHYRQAKALCQSAIDGLVDAEVARRAVIDAAERAGLLADKWTVDGKGPTPATLLPMISAQWSDQHTAEDDEVSDGDLVGYCRASDILNDPSLSPSRKKALLAYWASDIHAVRGASALRCAHGVTVSIDSLFAAMAKLDEEIDQAAMVSNSPGSSSRSW